MPSVKCIDVMCLEMVYLQCNLLDQDDMVIQHARGQEAEEEVMTVETEAAAEEEEDTKEDVLTVDQIETLLLVETLKEATFVIIATSPDTLPETVQINP